MPITKQAIKRVKQAKVKHDRNRHYLSRMKSMIKLVLGYIKKGEGENANKILSQVVSSIDTAAKKNIIHKNNASRKKSKIQKALSNVDKNIIKSDSEVKKPSVKKAVKKTSSKSKK
jgi:small subunit ribosomal protein S20